MKTAIKNNLEAQITVLARLKSALGRVMGSAKSDDVKALTAEFNRLQGERSALSLHEQIWAKWRGKR